MITTKLVDQPFLNSKHIGGDEDDENQIQNSKRESPPCVCADPKFSAPISKIQILSATVQLDFINGLSQRFLAMLHPRLSVGT